ncbi:MAG: VWA domain-containing protein [Chloroflexaceae bacterium]|nr:VWA domain-containing protein [Chloroflexaceae bacterium]
MILRNPQFLWLLALLPLLVLLWRWRGMRVRPAALVLRLLSVSMLVLALVDPVFGSEPPPPGPLIILADHSDNLTAQGKEAIRAQAQRLAEAAGSRASVLWFGANVVSGDAPTEANDQNAQGESLDPSATDIGGALSRARQLLGPGGGRIILLSDGEQNVGNGLEAARQAAAAGVQVDVQPVESQINTELGLASVTVPRLLRVGEEYPVQIAAIFRPADNRDGAMATLRLWEGDQLLAEEEVTLTPGQNDFTFRHTASAPGIARLRVELVGQPDTSDRNNAAAATALVAPPPRVLLVEGRDGAAGILGAALRNAGVETEAINASRMPARLSELDAYDGMVLFDVPATAFSLDQMASVREFVRSEGRGLLTIGGRNSFGLGAYKGTPLEETLPVLMEPPPRPERSDIAMLLIMDRSASMTAATGVSKFDMAKEAAILATESLRTDDKIGILSFDTGQRWVVPFQTVGQGLNQQQIQDAIMQLPSGGGTDIYAALATGMPEIANQQASVRHVVLLTDGRSFSNDMAEYQQLLEVARSRQITLSTIAIGEDADTDLLQILAQRGGGRYYFAATPQDIPRLTLLESEIARTDTVVEGRFQASLGVPNALVRDLVPADLPPLEGYIATTPRDTAEVVLRSPSEDPVLVTWQYGLGRSVAWTSSSDAPWAENWRAWPDYSRFWAQIVRYTLPDPDSGPLQVRVDQQPGGARLLVDALQPGGEPLDLATVTARVTLPDGSERDLSVGQVAPGRYTQDLILPADGAYAVTVGLVRGEVRQQAQVGYVQAVPPEYRLAPPVTGDPAAEGRALLEQIAQTTGGSVSQGQIAVGESSVSTDPADPGGSLFSLWPWLLGAALLLWLLEIAVRRGLLWVR